MIAPRAAWPSRRVNCGLQNVTWTEQTIPSGSELSEFFRNDIILSRLLELLGRSAQCKATVQCWLSRYGVGEFINSHRDNDGDIQIVLGASFLQPGNGGVLSVSYEEFSASYFLLPGDAVIFKAASVQHFTSPIIETASNQTPERIVAVARYSFRE
jgi:alkylated DNA repair dioxygenase AlkB